MNLCFVIVYKLFCFRLYLIFVSPAIPKLLVSACMQCFRSEKSESIPPYFVQVCHKCNNLKREVMLYPLFHASTSSSVAFTAYSSRIYALIRSVFINSQLHICTSYKTKPKKKSWGSAPEAAPTYVCISRTTFSFVPTAL